MSLFRALLLIGLFIGKIASESVVINDQYTVEWEIHNKEITFTVTAKATGWIGLGFGPEKHMKNADLVIGGVKDGKGYLFDMHGIDDDTPSLDQQEDYHLIEASENSTQTVLKFKRKLDTDDKDDVALTGPIWMLWAFNSDEDAREGNWPYHGSDRGHETSKRRF